MRDHHVNLFVQNGMAVAQEEAATMEFPKNLRLCAT
jgi:hypothetical protein